MKFYKIEKPNVMVLKLEKIKVEKEDVLSVIVYEGEYLSSSFFTITSFSIVNNNYIKFDIPLPLNSTVAISLQNETNDFENEIFLLKKKVELLEEAIKNRISHDEIKKYLSMIK